MFKIDWNCNCGCIITPALFASACLGTLVFTTFYTTLSAKDHWWGFSTRNVHMDHIVYFIRLKMVYTSQYKSIRISTTWCHCWWTSESSRAHVAKFYGRLRLIRSVWRASTFSVFKIDWNCNCGCIITPSFFASACLGTLVFTTFYTTLSAKDHWWGFSTRNVHMDHIVYFIRLKMVYTT